MITLNQRVAAHFEESIKAKQLAKEVLTDASAQAAQLMFEALVQLLMRSILPQK